MARSMNPRAITVMGGPNIDSYSDNGIKDFLSNMPQLDFYVPGEGEYKFEMLVNALKNNDMAASRVWTDIPSSVVGLQNNDFKKGSKNVPQYCDLNKMPSCYLTGLMDKFIDDPALVPIIETSRGCPHTCAYCCWGKAERVRRFPLERVYGEIEYIAQRTKIFVNAIYVADANFGSAARDVEIAEKIRKSSIERGFPKKAYIYFTSNVNDHTVKIAGILKDFTPISMSKQTTNQDALRIIKRRNLSDSRYDSALESIRATGAATYCEFIYGLPGESYESFIMGLESVAKKGLYSAIYPLLLYRGAEINSKAFREEHEIKSAYRLIPRYAGTYGTISSAEYEELLISHKKYTRKDYFRLRRLHLLHLIFIDGIFADMVRFLKRYGLNPVSFAIFSAHDSKNWPASIRKYIRNFERATHSELMAASRVKKDFTEKDIVKMRETSFALNILYLCILISGRGILDDISFYLANTLERFLDASGILCGPEEPAFVIKCCSDKIPDFTDFEPFTEKEYDYDLEAWLDSAATVPFSNFRLDLPERYRFEFNRDGVSLLKEMLRQYKRPEMALYHFRMNAVSDRTKVLGYARAKGAPLSLVLGQA